MPPLLADFIHARGCKPICEKSLTLPKPPLRNSRPVAGNLRATRRAGQEGRGAILPQRSRQSKISILTVPSSTSQATYRLRRAFSFPCQAHRALIEAAPRFQTEPASPGFGLGPPLRGVFSYRRKLSILTAPFTSEQSSLCPALFVSGQKSIRLPCPALCRPIAPA